jgi:hypothetical protein
LGAVGKNLVVMARVSWAESREGGCPGKFVSYFLKNCIDGFADPCLFNFIFSQENYAVFKTLFFKELY